MQKSSMARALRSRGFVFTLNNYSETDAAEVFKLQSKYCIIGKEVGETGTPHLQGYIQYNGQKSVRELRGAIPRAHIEAAKGSPLQNKKYCEKGGDFEETGDIPIGQGARVELPKAVQRRLDGANAQEMFEEFGTTWARYKRFVEEQVAETKNERAIMEKKKKFENAVLRPWQQECMGRLIRQNERQILFVIDPAGNSGKSYLGDFIVCNYNALKLETTKKTDIAYAYKDHEWLVFDLSRQSQEFIQYGTLENMKGNFLFSGKYESKMKALKDCKIVVFMNEDPNMDKLTADRYDLYYIDQE